MTLLKVEFAGCFWSSCRRHPQYIGHHRHLDLSIDRMNLRS